MQGLGPYTGTLQCEQTERQTHVTENITFNTALAGGKIKTNNVLGGTFRLISGYLSGCLSGLVIGAIFIVVNFHHFRRHQLPVEEDQFIHIYPGLVIILIHVLFPKNQSTISRCGIRRSRAELSLNQSAILENLETLVISWPNVIHQQMGPLVLHFRDVQSEEGIFQGYVETEGWI